MRANHLLFAAVILLFSSCSKETEEFQTEALSTYLPAQTGKYITYRTDSTIFINFGAALVTRSYQEKHVVDALTTDNLGRPSYRIFRFLRDTAGTSPWQPSGSYFITPLDKTVEVVENNLRFLKLTAPLKEDNSWKGNRFIPTDPYTPYDLGTVSGIEDWDYTYTNIGGAVTLGGKTYANTATVEQVIEFPENNLRNNFQVANTQLYGFKNYAIDKYAKDLGLIYQELIIWEYQPPTSQRSGYRGFGVKRSIIDHN